MFTKFPSIAGQQFTHALEELTVHVRAIEDNQNTIMGLLQRIEQGMYHSQGTPPATTNLVPMVPNMHNTSVSMAMPVAHNIPMPMATNSSLPNVPNTSLPMLPNNSLPVPSNTSPSMATNTSLRLLPTTPLPLAPATAHPLFGTRESPSEPFLTLDSTTTPNHPEPFALNHTYVNYCLPSDEILKDNLKCVEDVLRGCEELKCVEKASTLAQKLAREAFFGEDVMKRCTPGGTKDFPALPKEEMFSLKKEVFLQLPQFWQSPANFEKIWKTKCWPAVEQACRRLRRKRQYTCN